jgi:hypothetical protein
MRIEMLGRSIASGFAYGALLFGLHAHGQDAARPDVLMQVDMNRTVIVERIASAWSAEISGSQIASFRTKLLSLRADELLAASLSGSLDGVLELLHSAEFAKGTTNPTATPTKAEPAIGSGASFYAARVELFQSAASGVADSKQNSLDRRKSLGDADRDLVYTPVTPCRLFDTRAGQASALGTVGGAISNDSRRLISAAGACGIPSAGVRSIMLSFHSLTDNPPVLGIVSFMAPSAPLTAMAATWTGGAWVTGTFIAPTNNSSQFEVYIGNPATMRAEFVADVVGYFQAPNRNGDGLRVIANALSPTMVGGSATNVALTDVRGGTVAGGGAAVDSDPLYGGEAPNRVLDHYGFVGGGVGNSAGKDDGDVSSSGFATVVGGKSNAAEGSLSAVLGGTDNRADGYISTVVGGERNRAGSSQTFIGGGLSNQAFGNQSAIVGGTSNTAGGNLAAVGGGQNNSSAGIAAAISGGSGNSAGGEYSAVAGGFNNAASGSFASVTGGRTNFASGTASAIVGGEANIASGFYSLASGRGAKTQTDTNPATPHHGTFLWADGADPLNPNAESFHSSSNNQFAVRARGGIVFKVGLATAAGDGTPGCVLPAGGAAQWSCSSDRRLKEGVQPISQREVLRKVLSLPMTTWQFKGSPNRHLSPMAQDFWHSFGLGLGETQITASDVSGVALAAIQGLNQKLANDGKAKDVRIAALEAKAKKVDALEKANESLQRELTAIKKKLGL